MRIVIPEGVGNRQRSGASSDSTVPAPRSMVTRNTVSRVFTAMKVSDSNPTGTGSVKALLYSADRPVILHVHWMVNFKMPSHSFPGESPVHIWIADPCLWSQNRQLLRR